MTTPTTHPKVELDDRFSGPKALPTPWDEARTAISDAQLFWISTVRRDGRPHVTPLPAVWRDDRLHFCTGEAEQKALNLQSNHNVVLTTGTNVWNRGLDVVVEGIALRVTDEDRLRVLARDWDVKYKGDWKFDVVDGGFRHEGGDPIVFEVVPRKIIAFAKGPFAQTRYLF